MEDEGTLIYDTRLLSTVLKKFFSDLAESFLTKLQNHKYHLESVINYYSNFEIIENFCLNYTSEDKVLQII